MAKVNIVRWDDVNFIPKLLDETDTALVNALDVAASGTDLNIGSVDAINILIGSSGSIVIVRGPLTASAGAKISGSVNLPGQTSFMLDGVPVSTSNFTAPNLSRLFNGSNVDDLHTHSASTIPTNPDLVYSMIAGTVLTGSQVVYLSGMALSPADNNSVQDARVVGVVSGSTSSFFASGSVTPVHTLYGSVLSGFSGLLPGVVYYLSSSAGKITPTPTGKVIFQVGIAKSPTELVFQPLFAVKGVGP